MKKSKKSGFYAHNIIVFPKELAHQLKTSRLARWRWLRIVSVLASFVVFITVYFLILPAATISSDDAQEGQGFYLEEASGAASEVYDVQVIAEESPALEGADSVGETSSQEVTDFPEDLSAGEEAEPVEEAAAEAAGENTAAESDDPSKEVTAQEASLPAGEDHVQEATVPAEEDSVQGTSATWGGDTIQEVTDSPEEDSVQKAEDTAGNNTESGNDSQPALREPDASSNTDKDSKPEGTAEKAEAEREPEEKEEKLEERVPDNAHRNKTGPGELSWENGQYRFTLRYEEDAKIPEQSGLEIKVLEPGTEEHRTYYRRAMDAGLRQDPELDEAQIRANTDLALEKYDAAMEAGNISALYASVFDIGIVDAEGQRIEPQAAVDMDIAFTEGILLPIDTELRLVHFPEENTVEREPEGSLDAGLDAEQEDEKEPVSENPAFSVKAMFRRAAKLLGVSDNTILPETASEKEDKIPVASPSNLRPDTSKDETKQAADEDSMVSSEDRDIGDPEPAELLTLTELSEGKEEGRNVHGISFRTDSFSVYALICIGDFRYEEEQDAYVYTLPAEGEGFQLTLAFSADEEIPKEAALKVAEISAEDPLYEELCARAAEKIQEAADARFFDIEISLNGEKIEPQKPVTVRLELKDAAAQDTEPQIVHFIEDQEGNIRDVETIRIAETGSTADRDGMMLEFTAESFSVYGVITNVTGPSGSVNDLGGYTFKLGIGNRYLTSSIINDETHKFGKTTDPDEAAVWTFEETGTSGQYYISTFVGGQKQYMNLNRRDNNNAHAALSSNPQVFTVRDAAEGRLVISAQSGGGTYYLNEFSGWTGNGFAGWYPRSSDNDRITRHLVQAAKEGQYMIVVRQDDKYYIVLNDGSLQEAEYDEANNRVNVDYPLLWTFRDGHLYHESEAVGFTGSNLTSDYYYTYLEPDEDRALVSEGASDVEVRDGDGPRVEERKLWNSTRLVYDEQNHRIFSTNGTVHYIGAEYDEDKERYVLKGNHSAGQAAEIYLAEAAYVPVPGGGTHDDHTVNHIDISIYGGAAVSVPLAYGDYYDENGQVIYTATEEAHILKFSTADDTIPKESVRVSTEDLKGAEIKATAMVGGQMRELQDAFYITGYSNNRSNETSSDQLRIEGSFKVANLPHEANADNRPEICSSRKENRIFYTVTMHKEITVDLKINGQQLYRRKDGKLEKMTIKVPITLSSSFDYWDERNECPGVHIGLRPKNDFEQGWKDGKILGEGFTMSGMDFVLGSEVDEQKAIVPALEITKYIQTLEGETLETLHSSNIRVKLYYKPRTAGDENYVVDKGVGTPVEPAELAEIISSRIGFGNMPLAEKEITVGKSGVGMVYDYDVEHGMFYIREDEASVPQELTGADGKSYRYVKTRIDTEYSWRTDTDYKGKMHHADGFVSMPEVLGPYAYQDNTDLDNTFLEFYIYNIYDRHYPLEIKKVDSTKAGDAGNAAGPAELDSVPGLGGAEFDLYGPYTESETGKDGFDPKQASRKVNTSASLVTGNTGSLDFGDLTTGIYYLAETKAPSGYQQMTAPVRIVIDPENEGTSRSVVSYTQEGNQLPDSGKGVKTYTDQEGKTHYILIITNPSGVELPHTGGSGTAGFRLAGLMLVILAGLFAARRRRYIS